MDKKELLKKETEYLTDFCKRIYSVFRDLHNVSLEKKLSRAQKEDFISFKEHSSDINSYLAYQNSLKNIFVTGVKEGEITIEDYQYWEYLLSESVMFFSSCKVATIRDEADLIIEEDEEYQPHEVVTFGKSKFVMRRFIPEEFDIYNYYKEQESEEEAASE